MRLNKINEEFTSYVNTVYDVELKPIQYREIQRAFYAGCSCVYKYFYEIALVDDKESNIMLNELRTEINNFVERSVNEG